MDLTIKRPRRRLRPITTFLGLRTRTLNECTFCKCCVATSNSAASNWNEYGKILCGSGGFFLIFFYYCVAIAAKSHHPSSRNTPLIPHPSLMVCRSVSPLDLYHYPLGARPLRSFFPMKAEGPLYYLLSLAGDESKCVMPYIRVA